MKNESALLTESFFSAFDRGKNDLGIRPTGSVSKHGFIKVFTLAAMMVWALAFCSSTAFCLADNHSESNAEELEKLLNGKVIVSTSDLNDGITGVTGKIYIDAPGKDVWSAITDYDNQKNFVPKIIDSGLISDNGSEQVMFETGKTGVLFFRKTVYIKLKLKGEYAKRLAFQLVDGDFKIYQGEWVIEDCLKGKGSMLTFRAKIKPDFFAPAFFVRSVQQKDLPMVLQSMKKRAESMAPTTTRL
ncbi:MAG TPA: SRPBCC family protein [Chlorobaculum sp.]|nr:SRPBCC family protein [Chlorobaculum sp.]